MLSGFTSFWTVYFYGAVYLLLSGYTSFLNAVWSFYGLCSLPLKNIVLMVNWSVWTCQLLRSSIFAVFYGSVGTFTKKQ